MGRLLGLTEHTLFAELMERSLDAMFDEQFPENGSFVAREVTKGEDTRRYWYYVGYQPASAVGGKAKRYSRYVGPADDPAIGERVKRFQRIKKVRQERASLVAALTGAGLPRPVTVMGRVIEALAKAGLFRLRAVLVGSAAYQTYSGLLGVRLQQTFAMTGDVDVAQFRSISIGVEDRIPNVLDVLREVDASFRPQAQLDERRGTTIFTSDAQLRVDFLTPRSRDEDGTGAPLPMPALGGAAAQPWSFLDYLIHQPVRSVVLYGPGIAVNVPAPERFAVHKLIISNRRQLDGGGIAKAAKISCRLRKLSKR